MCGGGGGATWCATRVFSGNTNLQGTRYQHAAFKMCCAKGYYIKASGCKDAKLYMNLHTEVTGPVNSFCQYIQKKKEKKEKEKKIPTHNNNNKKKPQIK